MEWTIIGVNFLYAVLGVVLMFGAYRVIDRLTPDCDMFSMSPAAANVPLSTIADSTPIPFVTRSSKPAMT